VVLNFYRFGKIFYAKIPKDKIKYKSREKIYLNKLMKENRSKKNTGNKKSVYRKRKATQKNLFIILFFNGRIKKKQINKQFSSSFFYFY
jgi:hypothetical protein